MHGLIPAPIALAALAGVLIGSLIGAYTSVDILARFVS